MLSIPIEIKELLHTDSVKKNIRIHFPNAERTDICNNLIVRDSVKFTESVCSQDSLKFGLCESPIFEFETVGVENIKGDTIEVFCEVYCEANTEDAVFRIDIQAHVYPIPLGVFVVSECERQADIIHRKITAYGTQANYKWDSNDAFLPVIDNYSWSSSQSISFTLEELCDLIDAKYAYKRHIDELVDAEIIVDTITSGDSVNIKELTIESIGFEFDAMKMLIDMPGFIEKLIVAHVEPNKAYYNGLEEALNQMQLVASARWDWKTVKEYTLPRVKYYMWKNYGERSSSAHINSMDGVYMSIPDPRILKNFFISEKTIPILDESNYSFLMLSNGNIADSSSKYVNVKYTLKLPYKFVLTSRDGSTEYFRYETDPGNVKYVMQSLEESANSLYKLTTQPQTVNVYRFTSSIQTGNFIQRNDYRFPVIENIHDILQDYVELEGKMGRFNRDDEFELIDLKQLFGLTPSESLYPSENLYPSGPNGGSLIPVDYQSCDYDEHYSLPFGKIVCSFKDSSDADCIYEMYMGDFNNESDPNTFDVYDISNNELIKAYKWTFAQIESICNKIANNIDGVTYMPVQLIGRGLPYVEAGDTFTVLSTANDSITTIVLKRIMSGEMCLTDEYVSR